MAILVYLYVHQRVAGTANALVGGWGNLGGGVTQVVIGSVLFPLLKSFGLSPNQAWRTVCIVPALVAFTTGIIVPRISDDCPRKENIQSWTTTRLGNIFLLLHRSERGHVILIPGLFLFNMYTASVFHCNDNYLT